MTKQIQVSDEVYDRLKAQAGANVRSLGGQIEWLMNNAEGQSPASVWQQRHPDQLPLGDILQTTPVEPADERHFSDVLQEIRETEAERDEKLAYCQDDGEKVGIWKHYSAITDELWVEYYVLKGQQ